PGHRDRLHADLLIWLQRTAERPDPERVCEALNHPGISSRQRNRHAARLLDRDPIDRNADHRPTSRYPAVSGESPLASDRHVAADPVGLPLPHIVAWPEPFRAAFEQGLPRSVHGCTIGARLPGPFDADEPLGGAASRLLGLAALAPVSRTN